MSQANVTTFFEKLQNDPALQARVTSVEDAVKVAAELGLSFTAEEYAEVASSDELSPDALKNVAGGVRTFVAGSGGTGYY